MEIRSPRLGRQRILEMAEELFMQRGYRAVSIRDIAQACEVTNAALYYHFSGKDALFQEVMEKYAYQLSERMRQANEQAETARGRVTAILAEYARFSADRCSPFFLIRREADAIGKAKFREQFARLANIVLHPLEEALCQAVREGQLRSLPEDVSPAALLVGMLHGLAQHRHTCQRGQLFDEDLDLVVAIFWEGVGKQASDPDELALAVAAT